MCLLAGDCLTSSIVYKTTVHIENGSTSDDRHRIGLTVKTFKEMFAGYQTSFRRKRHANTTELSKYVRQLKKNDKIYSINWEILKGKFAP